MLETICRRFLPDARLLEGGPYGSGHIHDTFRVLLEHPGGPGDFILQRLNGTVFPDLEGVCDNVRRVCAHVGRKVAGSPDAARRSLRYLASPEGRIRVVDGEGRSWRMCPRITGVRTVDRVETPEQAWQAGRAFGRFQGQVADLPGGRLVEVIPDFHHTEKRFEAFAAAVAADPLGRAATAAPEIAFAEARRATASLLLDLLAAGAIPERIAHNDTKINNVLLDSETGEALCVIDLDTVMPGLVHYDFGDMVRTVTNAGEEDERDLSRVEARLDLFEALTRGYLEGAAGFLARGEVESLALSGKVLTFEVGLRFLTDHLLGDTYFRIHRPDHNLERCRAQFRLVESLEAREEEMDRLVRTAWGG